MMDDKAYHKVAPIIHSSEIFFDDRNRALWDAMNLLVKAGKKIDYMTVATKAIEKGYNDIGVDINYITGLANKVASAANIVDHALIIKDKWYGRQCISIIANAQAAILEGSNAEDTMARAMKDLRKLTSDEQTGAQHVKDVMKDLLEKALKASKRDSRELTGVPFTGVPSMDKIFDGREPGDLIIIGAGAKMGKSSTVTNILKYSIDNSIPTMAASAEMRNLRILARVLALMTDYATRKVERGDFYSEEAKFERIKVMEEKIENAPLWLSDSNLSEHKVISAIYHYYHNHGVELFLFDRIGLFDEVVQARPGQEYRNREAIMATLRKIANELGICIILYTQLTKEYLKEEGGRPKGHHIFGGIGGPANCTKAALIYRPEAMASATPITEFPVGPYTGQDCRNRAEIFTVYNNSNELMSALVGFNPYSQSFFEIGTMDVEDEDDFESEPIIHPGTIGTPETDLPF